MILNKICYIPKLSKWITILLIGHIHFFSIYGLSQELKNEPSKHMPEKIEDTNWVSRYNKKDIVDARYGAGNIGTLLKLAQQIPENINQVIIGQELAIQVLSDRVSQYLEGFPGRTREPIALNLVGLPGIGKSAMLDELRKMGFNVVQLDIQSYSENPNLFAVDLNLKLQPYILLKNPVILVIDEIDKIPEFNTDRIEKTSAIIGQLNQALTDGHMINSFGAETKLSNVMIVTTMNFSPQDIELFSDEVLDEHKSYYDFSIDDFQKFDTWIREQPAAKYKILSRLFRPNTVSRLAPNTLIMSPFSKKAYQKLARMYATKTVDLFLKKTAADKMARISIDQTLVDFLAEETSFAPSGARETVVKVNALIEQLCQFSMKLDGGDRETLARPRSVVLSYDLNQAKAKIRVVSYVWIKKQAQEKLDFEEYVKFNEYTGLFESPPHLVLEKPVVATKPKTNTAKLIKDSRFPMSAVNVKNMIPFINELILGQEEAVQTLAGDFSSYMARKVPAQKEPSARVFIGFPGIGKSELFNLTGKALDLPIVKINMQQFSAPESEAVTNFASTIVQDVQKARTKRPDGKYILLIEELDKVYEVNPQDRKLMNRPVMGLIKDILSDGRFVLRTENKIYEADFRDAFIGITMNFSVDRFGFKADPRMTSIEDVIAAWKSIKSTPADLKNIMMSMFLPETVSRLMSRMLVIKPLTKKNYQQVIDLQLEKVTDARLKNSSGQNVSQIEVSLSESYKDLLYNETVIPSEGARNTVTTSQKMISMDLEYALSKLPKKAKYATQPLKITFDYDITTNEVLSTVQVTSVSDDKPLLFARRGIALNFPPIAISGKISEDRLKVSLHEFGHAYVGALLGLRINSVVIVSPQAGIGGFVKFSDNGQSAYSMMAQIYSLLASRAMERIYLSSDPRSENSVMDITSGPSQDIIMATKLLFRMIYQLGMDPNRGTFDRMGSDGPSKYANFEDLGQQEVDRLSLILRKMENLVVNDILDRHTKTWLTNRVIKLAQIGAMNEKEFYKLVGIKIPVANIKDANGAIDTNSVTNSAGPAIKNEQMRKSFEKIIINYDQSSVNTKGSDHLSIIENVRKYKEHFLGLLKYPAAIRCDHLLFN